MKIETSDPSLSVNNISSNTQQQLLQNSSSPNSLDKDEDLKIDKEEVKQAVAKMNYQLQQDQRDVRYKIHEKTHRLMVQVIDHKTKEVLSTMPPEKILDIIASFDEQQSVAVNKKA